MISSKSGQVQQIHGRRFVGPQEHPLEIDEVNKNPPYLRFGTRKGEAAKQYEAMDDPRQGIESGKNERLKGFKLLTGLTPKVQAVDQY